MIDLGINRDHAHIWIDNDGYLQSDKQYVLDYIRCGFDDEKGEHIAFVDPPGGPMMSIGSQIGNHTITKIECNGKPVKIFYE